MWRFHREFWPVWIALVSGIASFIIAFFKEGLSPALPFWLSSFACLVIAAYLIWAKANQEGLGLAERLRPRLSLSGVAKKMGDRFRIEVCNLSGVAVWFSAVLERISPAIEYQVPAFLQITGTEPPHRESVVAGNGKAFVDVFLDPFGSEQQIGILSAEHPSQAVGIPRERYEVRICVFPVSQGDGSPTRRCFYFIPHPDGTSILSDAGTPIIPAGSAAG